MDLTVTVLHPLGQIHTGQPHIAVVILVLPRHADDLGAGVVGVGVGADLAQIDLGIGLEIYVYFFHNVHSIGPHCSAIALAMPGNVTALSLPRLGPGLA